MQIKLKSLHVENFKGIKLLDVVFGDKTKIKGQNAAGKTTIFDSFTWLLFNKNSAGEEKFNARPLDAAGNRIDNVEMKVVAVLDIDGKEIELSKVQKQNWVKKRGTNTAVLQGNVNSFEIDGYPKSEAEYKAYISGLVAEDLFKMLTNPQFFSGMKWKDQRDILMRFVSDISDVELARENDEFADLIPELEKAPSTDDIQKKFSKALSEWKKKQAEIPVRIDELSKSLVDMDVAEQELAKNELERRIAEIDSKIADSSKEVDALCGESMQLQFEINAIYTQANDELIQDRRKLENAKYDAENAFNEAHRAISDANKKIEENNEKIRIAEEKRSELGKQYNEEYAKTFNPLPYTFNEEEWQFDNSSTICKSCGQELPVDRIEQIKAEFEERKAKAKADAEKKRIDCEKSWTEKHNAILENIKADGFEQKHKIAVLKEENSALQEKIELNRKAETDAMGKKNQIEKQIADLPEKPDMSGNAEYQRKKARYDDLEKQIIGLKDSANAADTFKEERKGLVAELDVVKDEISKASQNVKIEERIAELEEEQREVGQKVADQEKMIYLLDKFIQMKMDMVSEEINKHFRHVSFRLFKEQFNGGIVPTCEIKYVKESRGDLNNGHRIVAGLDIIQSLSELYSVTAPIFVDNAESLNEYNVPDMAAQMILLAVSDDKELRIEVE